MLKINQWGRRSAAMLAIPALAIALGGSAAQAKSIKKYKVVCKGKLTGASTSAGTCTGSLGKGKFKVSLTPPTTTSVVKYKGGTVTVLSQIVLKGNKVTSKWKVKKGTGKFKHAKGKGVGASALDPKTGITTATSTGVFSY